MEWLVDAENAPLQNCRTVYLRPWLLLRGTSRLQCWRCSKKAHALMPSWSARASANLCTPLSLWPGALLSSLVQYTQCNLNDTGVAIVKQVSIILRGQTEAVEWWEQRNRDWRLWPRGARHCGQLHVRHRHPQPGMWLKLVYSKFSS